MCRLSLEILCEWPPDSVWNLLGVCSYWRCQAIGPPDVPGGQPRAYIRRSGHFCFLAWMGERRNPLQLSIQPLHTGPGGRATVNWRKSETFQNGGPSSSAQLTTRSALQHFPPKKPHRCYANKTTSRPPRQRMSSTDGDYRPRQTLNTGFAGQSPSIDVYRMCVRPAFGLDCSDLGACGVDNAS